MSSSRLRLALPSKGMEDDTLAFLRNCGLTINRTNPRQYQATMRGLPGGAVDVVFQRAGDIFDEVNQGTVDLGLTGYDIVAEHRFEEDDVLIVHGELGYQRCSLVLAIPEGWLDVSSVADLAEVTADLRARGHELRIATKYPNLTRQFLYDRGITYFRLVEVSGALEAAPSLDTADAICDLTSSGVTLRENRLRTIRGGEVLASQACLIGHRPSLLCEPAKLEATRGLLEMVEAYLRSRGRFSLTANIRGESAEAIAQRVTAAGDAATGLRGPTVARVYPRERDAQALGDETKWFAVTIIVLEATLLAAVEALRRAGASEVTAAEVRYVFEHRSWTFERLKRDLEGRPSGEAA